MSGPHQLILASAGTGKTYRLTGRFLDILFDDVPPERILATTFTRKAAGEILDRVLRRLVEAAEDDGERAALAAQLGRELSADAVRDKLIQLLRSLDRFRVRTLDAFFVQLAKLFALDLGLPPDWTIVEEAADQALRREALGSTLEHAASDELLDILRGLQQSDASRSIERVLLRRVEDGRNAYLDSLATAWRCVNVPPGLKPQDEQRLVDELEALELPRTKAGTPNQTWKKARAKLADLLARGVWKQVPEEGIVRKSAAGETFARAAFEPEWLELLARVRRQAAHVLLGEVDRENEAAHRWLERFEASYEGLKREERAYRFEDLPKALHPREGNRLLDQDLVWYRLDGKVDHLLLDEFQDTSPVQWRLLRNLAEEILADGTGERSFFCVGDVKQSIYGWREAEPRLLRKMDDAYPVLEPEPMNESWRSSRIVLDTVARVFGRISDNPVFSEKPAKLQAAREFEEDFDAPTAARDLPGAAWLLEAPEAGEDEREHRPALRLAAKRVRAIVDEAPGATVGVLLRRNTWVPELIHLLRQERLRASGEGGNPLVDSAAVLHFVSLLHLADHPGDTAAAFHVATSPLAATVGFTVEGFDEQRAEVAAVVRKRLAVEGYGAFCASFLDVVAERYGPWDRKRFDQLVDLAYSFEDQAGLRTDHFVDHVRVTPVEDPSATQVKVMTVHASKGLEFDAVVLPELDANFSIRMSPLFTQRRDPAGLLDAVSCSRSSKVCKLDPGGLDLLYQEQERRETREALCLLYVAATRARHRLDMIVQHRTDPGKAPRTFAGIVCNALAPGAAADAAGVVWRHPEGDESWFPRDAARAAPSPPAVVPAPRFRDGGVAPLLRRTPSAQEGAGRLEPTALLRSPSSAPRLRGLLVHRWLQEIEWLDDFRSSDEELLAIGRTVTRDARLLGEALRELRALLERPNTRALLARPDDGSEREVWRERSFAVVLPDASGTDELWSGTFDRVVLRREGGRPVAADLIDYKTDRIEPDDLEDRTAFYRPQLEGYARVLSHMTGLPPGAVTARLAFVHADVVRDLP